MAQQSIQSGLTYIRNLLPETLVRSVSTVQTTFSLRPSAVRRCFPVCTSSRGQWRALEASSMEELLEQVARVLVLPWHPLTLVLEEDGTVVDSEFFPSLHSNTPLMVLEEGQTWMQNQIPPTCHQPPRTGIAKLTFDLYKVHPKDFLCCLAIKADVYEMYTLSHDFRCTGMKRVLRWALRCLNCLTRLTGQLLLCTASSLPQFTVDDDL